MDLAGFPFFSVNSSRRLARELIYIFINNIVFFSEKVDPEEEEEVSSPSCFDCIPRARRQDTWYGNADQKPDQLAHRLVTV